MNILRNAIKLHVSVRTVKPTHVLPSFLREPPKRFSTEPDQQQQQPLPDASINQFLDSASKGFVYGKLFGITKYTMKSDIISLLEGCNLTPDDIKVSYSRSLFPVAMMLRFPSPSAFSNAARTIRRFDRLYRLDRVVLQGLPRSAALEDVERFLSGCEYDSSSIQTVTFTRPGFTNLVRLTTVQFPSHIEAMNACISKNRKICLNNQISVRVLY
ncbi:hypothetical protein ERO13_A13G095390v2 [Gossypium hirsutum]|uniref:Uncharacterized protein isoform X2 n=1 Tax=Gossypium hirsutum TaxID=3635 RepID=A0ABM2ZHG8_GOSHI|nr:uncharacterized protein LOC107893894 isoform X2 [Gossypium hirsutum]KAG4165676.1 hypothetical protein ERO13_A13G095390v2 [Gossypium hirsutum]